VAPSEARQQLHADVKVVYARGAIVYYILGGKCLISVEKFYLLYLETEIKLSTVVCILFYFQPFIKISSNF